MEGLPPEEGMVETNNLCSNLSNRFPLHVAIMLGHTEKVKELLKTGSPVNEVDSDQISPLHVACQHGHLDIIKLLIEEGAFINVPNIDGSTPLCEASSFGSEECVKFLLSKGALVNPPLALCTPLHDAALSGKNGCVQILVDAGAKLDASDCHYGTPLHIAALTNNSALAGILLRAGASVNITKIHRNALHIATSSLEPNIVTPQLLEFGADVYARDNKDRSPKDLIQEDNPLHALLQYLESNPRTLKEICRYRIRKLLGAKRLRHIYKLRLPTPLAYYLDYQ